MMRRDYIIRVIEEFGVRWAQLVEQMRAKHFPSAQATVQRAYQQVLGLQPDLVRALSSRDLQARMQFGETPENGRDRCLVLCALLKADADLALASQQPDLANNYYQKALDIVLFLKLQHSNAVWPPFAPPVDQLVASLAGYTLPVDTQHALFHYYEQQGAYAKAEDALFAMLEQNHTEAVIALGSAFYLRLQSLSDAQLHDGNFSRAEIGAGKHALQVYTNAS